MYQKTVLPNKLKVLTHHMKERDSIAVGLLIGSGGRYEDDKNKGAAHFLEHILFKGSKKYSCTQIKELIEGVGGTLNAFTSEESTCYFAKIPAKHINRTFEILADMVFYPLIKAEDVKKERTVILEEIKMYHDVPQYHVLELLDGLMWPNHPLGENLAGTFESVGNMKADELKAFHQQNYFPENIIVSACGAIDHERFVQLVSKNFKRPQKSHALQFLSANNTQSAPKTKFFRKEVEQMHLALGMFGLPVEHKSKYAFNLMNVILGANMSSRLFNEVRERRGLAYSIASSAKSLKDTGLFLIRAGVDNQKITDAITLILKELKKMTRSEVKKDELVRAKDYFLGQVLLGLEDTMDQMLWMAESELVFNRVKKLEEIIQEVKKISIPDIKDIAREILQEKHYNLALVGPVSENQEKEIQNLFF